MNLHEELARLEALDAKRTQGEWRTGSWKDNVFAVTATSTYPHEQWAPICRVKRDDENVNDSPDMHDAAFIANAPAMMRCLRAFAAENKAQRELIEKLVGALEAHHKGAIDRSGYSKTCYIANGIDNFTNSELCNSTVEALALAEQQMRGSHG